MPSIPLPRSPGVYQITCIPTGKIYIGSSQNICKRWVLHLSRLRAGWHHSVLLQRAWAKYGEDAFTIEVLEACNPEMLTAREQHYLDTLRPFNPDVGFNIALDAQAPTRGRKQSPETKAKRSRRKVSSESLAKMQAANKGRVKGESERQKLSEANKRNHAYLAMHTPEAHAKRAAALRGIPRSPETKAKISAANLGRKRSEESRQRMRESAQRRATQNRREE